MSNSEQPISLNKLIGELKEHLIQLGYSDSAISDFVRAWSKLEKYAATKGTTLFTTELGITFLWDEFRIKPQETGHDRSVNWIRRSVELLDSFQKHGRIYKSRRRRIYVWPKQYEQAGEAFMASLIPKGLAERTLHVYRSLLETFTEHLIMQGIFSLDNITAPIIDNHLESYKGYQKSSIARCCRAIASFLEYAFENGNTCENKALCVPDVRAYRYANMPSAFTVDELKRILLSVDRANPQGKRDYAILLLGVQYGIRVGDIRTLKLNDLDFTSKKISFVQSKTSVAISFDMLKDVGWALIDYIKNGRPETNSEYVFVRLIAPYDSFADSCSLSHIIKKYLSRAGILIEGRHHCMHALRLSLTSRLLKNGQPLHVVSQALGHENINSTMIYTQIDIPQLSLFALEVPDVTA
ncbi:MAG: Tyrosine recombinase XerD [Firmicutes bacterium ADurb.Bin356]|nr:MAG: Tyrosine recombinase XerD [Firmicutes bacterium ADurb.Bin356]